MVQNFFRQFDVAFRAPRTGIVTENRFAEAGRFGEADTSRNYGLEDLVPEEIG
jgi:hypothetical protein